MAKASRANKDAASSSAPSTLKVKIASLKKALKGISSRLPAGKQSEEFFPPKDNTNAPCRKRRPSKGEGDQAAATVMVVRAVGE